MLHLANFRHQRLDHGQSLVHRRANFIIKIVIKISPRNSNAKRLCSLAETET